MPRRINLLPKTDRVRTTTNVPALALLVAGVLVVFALVLGYYLLSNQRSSLQSELTTKQEQRAKLEAQLAALSQYKALAAKAAQAEKVVQGVYDGRTLLAQVLSDLSRVVPENAWFTNMSISAGEPQTLSDDKKSIITGTGTVSVQGDTYSFPDVAVLLVRLKLVRALQGITLNSAGDPIGNVDPGKHVHGFSIVATVVNTQAAGAPLPVTKVEVEGL